MAENLTTELAVLAHEQNASLLSADQQISLKGGHAQLCVALCRGSPCLVPDETLASFQRAMDDGADYIEMDAVSALSALQLLTRHFRHLTAAPSARNNLAREAGAVCMWQSHLMSLSCSTQRSSRNHNRQESHAAAQESILSTTHGLLVLGWLQPPTTLG